MCFSSICILTWNADTHLTMIFCVKAEYLGGLRVHVKKHFLRLQIHHDWKVTEEKWLIMHILKGQKAFRISKRTCTSNDDRFDRYPSLFLLCYMFVIYCFPVSCQVFCLFPFISFHLSISALFFLPSRCQIIFVPEGEFQHFLVFLRVTVYCCLFFDQPFLPAIWKPFLV